MFTKEVIHAHMTSEVCAMHARLNSFSDSRKFVKADICIEGAIQEMRVKFLDHFRPLPPPVCYYVLFSSTPPC